MKKFLVMLLVESLVLSCLSGCNGDTTESSNRVSSTPQEAVSAVESTPTPEPTATPIPFNLDEYKATLSECIDNISTNALMYYNMCKYEVNYWETLNGINGTFSADNAFQHAMEWLEGETDESADSLSERHDNILELYKEIVFTEIDGTEAEKLLEVFEETYDSYIIIHDSVMSPSGDIDSFTSKFNDAVSNFNVNKSKLETLLS